MAGPDDLDALVPPAAVTVTLAGTQAELPTLTLARYASARRVARLLGEALTAEDLVDMLASRHAELASDFAAATGIEPRLLEEADAAEALAALFALAQAVRDFTTGPFTAALGAGVAAMAPTPAATRVTAPDGPTSSPGSSAAGTP